MKIDRCWVGLFWCVFACSYLRAMTIETIVSSPDLSTSGITYRGSLYHFKDSKGNDEVIYGECDILEPQCSRANETFRIRRRIPYRRYLEILARYFNIESRFLIEHERGQDVILSAIASHKKGMEDETRSKEERGFDEARYDALTQPGGIRDRFTKALAIKEILEEDAEVSLTYGREQYRQALWPMDFVRDIDNQDPLTHVELGTRKTWKFVDKSKSISGARQVCGAIGFRLPTREEIVYSNPWLIGSGIGNAVPLEQGARTEKPEKKIWLEERGDSRRERRVQVSEYRYRYEDYYVYHNAYAYLRTDSVLTFDYEWTDSIKDHPALSVICVRSQVWK